MKKFLLIALLVGVFGCSTKFEKGDCFGPTTKLMNQLDPVTRAMIDTVQFKIVDEAEEGYIVEITSPLFDTEQKPYDREQFNNDLKEELIKKVACAKE